MRDIKFRVFSNHNYYYNYNFSLCIDGTLMVCDNDMIWRNIKESNNHKDAIIEQFTGLKDKNGVDIYEGDIIKMLDEWHEGDSLTKGFIGKVVYEDGSYGVVGDGKYEYMPLDEVCIHNYSYEVIGTIHNEI